MAALSCGSTPLPLHVVRGAHIGKPHLPAARASTGDAARATRAEAADGSDPVRLQPEEVARIRETVRRVAGAQAEVWLFGSHLRLAEAAGDHRVDGGRAGELLHQETPVAAAVGRAEQLRGAVVGGIEPGQERKAR